MLSTAGKEIPVPDEAEVFQFTFIKDGKEYGTVTISIDGLHKLVVYSGDDVAKSPSEQSHSEDISWYALLNHLKRFSQQHQLSFEVKNTDHLKYDMAKRTHMKKVDEARQTNPGKVKAAGQAKQDAVLAKKIADKKARMDAAAADKKAQEAAKIGQKKVNEAYYATGKKSSYSDNVPEVKILLQHNRQLEEGERRYRSIAKIFVENAAGERFAIPTNKPGLARVYARHIAEGGTPYDEGGKHITSLCEEYTKMAGFVRATRSKQFNESAQSLVNEGINHYQKLRETLHRMASHRGYNAYFESWTPALMEDDDSTDLTEMFASSELDPRIESVMPILRKLNKTLGEMTEVKSLDEWAGGLIEEVTGELPVAEAKAPWEADSKRAGLATKKAMQTRKASDYARAAALHKKAASDPYHPNREHHLEQVGKMEKAAKAYGGAVEEASAAAMGRHAENEFARGENLRTGAVASVAMPNTRNARGEFEVKHRRSGKIVSTHASAPEAVAARNKLGGGAEQYAINRISKAMDEGYNPNSVGAQNRRDVKRKPREKGPDGRIDPADGKWTNNPETMKKIDADKKKVAENAKWRQGYSASGHPAGYKHKNGDVGPVGGTYTNEPSGYDGETSKVPVQKHRDQADPLQGREQTRISSKGQPLTQKAGNKNLKDRIKRDSGKHGPVGQLPESEEGGGNAERDAKIARLTKAATAIDRVERMKKALAADAKTKPEGLKANLEKMLKAQPGSRQEVDELSIDALANYKKKASAQSSEADKAGDFEKGHKRFKGIVNATKKQFKQLKDPGAADRKDIQEGDGLEAINPEGIPEAVNPKQAERDRRNALLTQHNLAQQQPAAAAGPKRFPDTAQGAVDYLKSDSQPGFLRELGIGKPYTKIRQDPSVEGVWAIDNYRDGIRVVVYLGGYKDPWGKTREYGDFESGTIPQREMDAYNARNGISEAKGPTPAQAKRNDKQWANIVAHWKSTHNGVEPKGDQQEMLARQAWNKKNKKKIDEISQGTARSYAQKAKASQKDLIAKTWSRDLQVGDVPKLNNKIQKRQDGLDRAHTDKRYYKDMTENDQFDFVHMGAKVKVRGAEGQAYSKEPLKVVRIVDDQQVVVQDDYGQNKKVMIRDLEPAGSLQEATAKKPNFADKFKKKIDQTNKETAKTKEQVKQHAEKEVKTESVDPLLAIIRLLK